MKILVKHAVATFVFAAVLLPFRAHAEAKPTKVLVRAIARDAKIIGHDLGGAKITIEDAATGERLAEGEQRGGSGDTRLIMQEPRQRNATVFDTPGAAHFIATLELEWPTVVQITAEAPLDRPGYLYKASKTLLLIPGQDVLGEGIILEIHGFRVTLLEPTSAEFAPGADIPLRIDLVMI